MGPPFRLSIFRRRLCIILRVNLLCTDNVYTNWPKCMIHIHDYQHEYMIFTADVDTDVTDTHIHTQKKREKKNQRSLLKVLVRTWIKNGASCTILYLLRLYVCKSFFYCTFNDQNRHFVKVSNDLLPISFLCKSISADGNLSKTRINMMKAHKNIFLSQEKMIPFSYRDIYISLASVLLKQIESLCWINF